MRLGQAQRCRRTSTGFTTMLCGRKVGGTGRTEADGGVTETATMAMSHETFSAFLNTRVLGRLDDYIILP